MTSSRLHLPALLFAALCACSASSGGGGEAAQTVAVGTAPAFAELAAGGTATFAATVTGTADPSVVWEVVEAGGGTADASGRYVAPATPGVFHVRATSRAAPEAHGESTVTVVAAPVVVTVTPSAAAANGCTTVAFTAAVAGASDGSVTWAVEEGAAGGTITAAGVYTAPAAPGTYHVVATSRADATRSAVAVVTVREKVLQVAVAPQTIQLAPGGTARLTATVTTTCGAFTSTKTVTAPGAPVAE